MTPQEKLIETAAKIVAATPDYEGSHGGSSYVPRRHIIELQNALAQMGRRVEMRPVAKRRSRRA
jgi:hypothetical protein